MSFLRLVEPGEDRHESDPRPSISSSDGTGPLETGIIAKTFFSSTRSSFASGYGPRSASISSQQQTTLPTLPGAMVGETGETGQMGQTALLMDSTRNCSSTMTVKLAAPPKSRGRRTRTKRRTDNSSTADAASGVGAQLLDWNSTVASSIFHLDGAQPEDYYHDSPAALAAASPQPWMRPPRSAPLDDRRPSLLRHNHGLPLSARLVGDVMARDDDRFAAHDRIGDWAEGVESPGTEATLTPGRKVHHRHYVSETSTEKKKTKRFEKDEDPIATPRDAASSAAADPDVFSFAFGSVTLAPPPAPLPLRVPVPVASSASRSSSPSSSSERKVSPMATATPGQGQSLAPPTPYAQPGLSDASASMTREEFEALPPTIQRKYFSTLERRYLSTQPPTPAPTPTSAHDIDLSTAAQADFNSLATSSPRRRKQKSIRVGQDHVDRIRRRSSRRPSFYLNLPDKIQRQHLTKEEQQSLARLRRHHSNILSPVPQALHTNRLRRRRSSVAGACAPQTVFSSLPDPPRPSTMATQTTASHGTMTGQQKGTRSFYDTFRWLEDDPELDLRLRFDGYVPESINKDLHPPSKTRRPSFRRHLSMGKMSFSRSSISSRPGTMQGGSPTFPVTTPGSPLPTKPSLDGRRKSRTLSLISPKKGPNMGSPTFDPDAAHYQDPGARTRLKIFASPQMFDEAVQFGFPSAETERPPELLPEDKKEESRPQKNEANEDSEKLCTFLADDDKSSIYSNEDSVADSESPKTPEPYEKPTLRPVAVGEPAAPTPKPSADLLAARSSREMTLRMTLTRPDLRANEDQLYGWQKGTHSGRNPPPSALREDYDPMNYAREDNSKEGIEKQLAAMDQWHSQANDRGVMKRLWHKVRRG